MAVLRDANGTAIFDWGTTEPSPQDYTGLTVGTNPNRVLIVGVIWEMGNSRGTVTVTWDPGGANQVCEQIKYEVAANGNRAVEMFGLVNPVSGNKTLRVAWTGSDQGGMIHAVSYYNANQSGGTATFKNAVSYHGTDDPLPLQITTANGERTVSVAHVYDSSVCNQTLLAYAIGEGPYDGGMSEGSGTASPTETHEWQTAGADLAIVGCSIAMASGPPGTPTKYEVAEWNSSSSPKSIMNAVAVNNGDLLVCIAAIESTDPLTIDSDGVNEFVEQVQVGASGYSAIFLWTYEVTQDETLTVDLEYGSGGYRGAVLYRFHAGQHGGIGESGAAYNNAGDPSLTITGISANSAIVMGVSDWNAISGTQEADESIGSFNYATGYPGDGGHYGVVAGYYTNAGAAGDKTIGQTDPDGLKWGVVGIEVLGTAGGGGGGGLDAYLQKIFTKTPAVDSLLQKVGITGTASVDSFLNAAGLTRTSSLDAILYAAITYYLTGSLDAYLQGTLTKTPSLDSLLNKTNLTLTAGVDAYLQGIGLERTGSLDALLHAIGLAETASLDAILYELAEGIVTLSLDGLLQKIDQTKTLGTDSYLQKTGTRTPSLDAFLLGTILKTVGIDAALNKIGLTKTSSIDSLLNALGLNRLASVDALLLALSAKTLGTDAYLQRSGITGVPLIDAFLQVTGLKTPATDALLNKIGMTQTSALDAILIPEGGLLIDTSIDALLEKLNLTFASSIDAFLWNVGVTRSASVDALLNGVRAQTAGLDGYLWRPGVLSVSLDGFLYRTGTPATGLEALLQRIGALQATMLDGLLRGAVAKDATVDALLESVFFSTPLLDAYLQQPDVSRSAALDALLLGFGEVQVLLSFDAYLAMPSRTSLDAIIMGIPGVDEPIPATARERILAASVRERILSATARERILAATERERLSDSAERERIVPSTTRERT